MAIKAYNITILRHVFDVAPNGNSIFFCEDDDYYLKIYRIDTTSGAVLGAYQHSLFEMDSRRTFITVSEDSSSVHISAISFSNGMSYCIWDYTDENMQWILLSTIYPRINGIMSSNSFTNVSAISAISNQQSYLQMSDSSFNEILRINLSQSDNFTVWSSRINCQNECILRLNQLFLDSSNEKLYVATFADYKFTFLTLNPDNGFMIFDTSILYSNVTWSSQYVYKISMKDDILYIPVRWMEPTLLTYNITNDQFGDIYILNDTSSNFFEMSILLTL